MLLSLSQWLAEAYPDPFSWMRVFQYITFRAGVAVILSLIISMLFGGKIIRLLRSLQVGEEVRATVARGGVPASVRTGRWYGDADASERARLMQLADAGAPQPFLLAVDVDRSGTTTCSETA